MRRASSIATSRSWDAFSKVWNYSPVCRAAAVRWASMLHRRPPLPSARCASPPMCRRRSARRSRCCARIAPLSARCWIRGANGTSRGSSSAPTTSTSATYRCRCARSPPRVSDCPAPAAERSFRRRALRLLELVVEVNACGAWLAHRDPVEGRQVDGGLRDVVEERALVGDVIYEKDGGPALALEAAPDVGEIVGGQRIGCEGLVRAAADVVRLGPGR